MKKYFEEIVSKRTAKLDELKKRSEESNDLAEVRSIGTQMEEVKEELRLAKEKLAEIEAEEKRSAEQEKKDNAEARSVILGTYGAGETAEQREAINKEMEERAKDLREGRSILVATGKALLPKHTGTELNDTFKPVSTLVDMVAYEVLDGGESYQEAFVKSYGEGGITEEGASYTEAEPEFEYADMNKIKITAYAEVSEEVKKLPHIDYLAKIQEACMIALKKKMSQQILNGTGNKEMVGIFATPVAINSKNDITLTAIDNKTLNAYVFGYGGDEDVETMATLIQNKKTLKAMSEVAKEDGSLFYNIDINGKTVNTVPFVINSNVKPFETATAGNFVGAYGDPKAYKVVQFSPVEIKESSDYKFKEGMICFKASVFVAGNVIKQDGFLRAKKG